MAIARCPHCKSTNFGLETDSPTGSRFKVHYIHCTSCGAPHGVLPYYDTHALLKELEEKIEKRLSGMQRTINNIDHNVVQIGNELRNR